MLPSVSVQLKISTKLWPSQHAWLTSFLEHLNRGFHELELIRPQVCQRGLVRILPVNVHEIAPLEVLPVEEKASAALLYILNQGSERMVYGAVPSLIPL